jgi:hypothetical protein
MPCCITPIAATQSLLADRSNWSSAGSWKDTVANVVGFIENNQHRFYTKEGNASAWVAVRTSAAGNKFLQTYADGIWKDNLLALPECA